MAAVGLPVPPGFHITTDQTLRHCSQVSRRLLNDHDLVTEQGRAAILALLHQTNPAALRRHIGDIQNQLVYLARRRGQVKQQPNRHHVYASRTKIKNASKKRALSDESTNQPDRAS